MQVTHLPMGSARSRQNRGAMKATHPTYVVSVCSSLALVHSEGPEGRVGCPPISSLGPPDAAKHNADRRHHIPKMAFKVQNWLAYKVGLRRRGSLTIWFTQI